MEVEVKIKIFPGIEERLKSLGARLVKVQKEEDVYFSHPCWNFKEKDLALRLRKVGKDRFLTFKGPRLEGETKTRQEIETRVEENIFKILKALGFHPFQKVRKKRTLYRLKGLKISLDEVEGLGLFLEIEGRRLEDKSKIFEILSLLGFSPKDLIRKTYLELREEKK